MEALLLAGAGVMILALGFIHYDGNSAFTINRSLLTVLLHD